ncbi:hypothetical protein [Polyangium aurulentum]|uniref:hypothetical protein n=1 Tax=Polyangium aurulentum TaxID=2567896 RepID=UPI0010AE3264|nr:hypothetical protein [Polyangium aurulentum]UQA56443.1 hypothetical protein E8A73_034785 [Polyangium aurulentum]
MGEMIRRDGAAGDILADADRTLLNAKARGGRWAELAEQRLEAAIALSASVKIQLETAQGALLPLQAQIQARNDKADKTIGKVYDILWNEIGRPAHDAALSVIFPDGIAYYAEGDTSEQPDRMDILEQLLLSGVHPKLSKGTAEACAAEIREESQSLRAAVDAARKPAAQVKVLGRVRTALAKVVHAELSNLKRHYKIEGFSEAEIHTVIPDRPSKAAKKAE